MRLDEISLRSFAGFTEETVTFGPGLNLICGPNEAGKSTLMAALEVALFASGVPRKGSSEAAWLEGFFPRGGGDHFRVRLSGQTAGGKVTIRKDYHRDRKDNQVEVKVDDRAYAGQQATGEVMRKILGFGSQTYRTTVLINQGTLQQTVQHLQERDDDTIEQVLRGAVFESEGVSVKRFEERLSGRLKKVVQHWDLQSNQPMREARYARPGTILAAHYLCRDLDQKIRRVEEATARVEELRTVIKGKEQKREEEASEASRLEVLADKWQQHRDYEGIKVKHAAVLEAVRKWDGYETAVGQYDEDLEAHDRELEEHRHNRQQVEDARTHSDLTVLLGELENTQEDIEGLTRELDELPEVSGVDVQRLREMETAVNRAEARLDALQLEADFHLEEGVRGIVRKGSGGEEEVFDAGGRFTARGRFDLEVPGVLSLEVRSAHADLDRLQLDLEQSRGELAAELKTLGCDSPERARAVLAQRDVKSGCRRDLQNQLSSRLEARGFDGLLELQRRVEELEDSDNPHLGKGLPGLDELDEAERRLQEAKMNFIQENVGKHDRFAAWQEAYGDFVGAVEKQRELKNEMDSLEEDLPEDFDAENLTYGSPAEVRAEAQRLRDAAASLVEELHGLRQELGEEEDFLQEQSPAELQDQRREAELSREEEKKKARSLLMVQEAFQRVKDDLDRQTFIGLKARFASHLAQITDRRYEVGAMEGVEPGPLVRAGEGVEFPLHLLSAGTQDGAALSLRLAIAAEIFEPGEGLFVMDEPMVNLDTDRKACAAELLKQLARDFQVLVFSCDAETRDLLHAGAAVHEYRRRL